MVFGMISVKPRINDKNSLLPIKIKVGQNFTIPITFVGEPAPEPKWSVKLMVGVVISL